MNGSKICLLEFFGMRFNSYKFTQLMWEKCKADMFMHVSWTSPLQHNHLVDIRFTCLRVE
jgi:hypothetical protein